MLILYVNKQIEIKLDGTTRTWKHSFFIQHPLSEAVK